MSLFHKIMLKSVLYNLATDTLNGFFPGAAKFVLLVASFLYGLGIRVIRLFRLFSRKRLPCAVVSIGNITLGGTGKTLIVEYVARYLQSQGKSVAVLSRGYKRTSAGTVVSGVENGPIVSCLDIGDEPYMLAKKLRGIPVLVDGNRIRAAYMAHGMYAADTVVFDDGFQQWGIYKDLEIVALNSEKPFGNMYMIPRGILREPVSSLRRADIFIITKVSPERKTESLRKVLSSLNPSAEIVESDHVPEAIFRFGNCEDCLSLDSLRGKSAVIFSGIGDPASFDALLTRLGLRIAKSFLFDDHHQYTREDLRHSIENARKLRADYVVTTEKDAVRLSALPEDETRGIWVLRIKLNIHTNEEGLHRRLRRLHAD
ncbi:MAG: tetraacyldisaccharide 4'-kinase [Candidatus Omnitrophica bacterium]|nr:tetraacyldisaccharide 4'-kinase [Candidatus Omnitrophota bacterium]